MNSAKNDIRSPLARQGPNLVAAQSIGGVNADAHGVTGLNALGIHLGKGFIHKNGVAVAPGSGPGKHVLPTRSDNRGPERHMARVNQVNVQAQCSLLTADFSEQFHESLAEHASTSVVFLVRRLIFWALSGTSQRALPGRIGRQET